MIEWLLKEEEKNKVGRPIVLKQQTIRKSFFMLLIGFFGIFGLSFALLCKITDKSPLYYLAKFDTQKILGKIENKDGFIVDSYYKDDEYIIKVEVTKKIKSYAGKYKYVLYEYKKGNYNELESEIFDNTTNSFRISIKRLTNKIKTYKIRLEIIDTEGDLVNYAPTGWEFNNNGENNTKYAYKLFTVNGTYSPISSAEIKEAKKNENKVCITVDEHNPRKFTIDNKQINYDVLISYTDEKNKVINLPKNSDLNDPFEVVIPDIKRTSTVTFKIWLNDVDKTLLKKYKLSNWEIKKDKGKSYLMVSYNLKPSGSYK